jgi:hypothetical protein
MHSDWLLGYIFRYYLMSSTSRPANDATDVDTSTTDVGSFVGIKNYPTCGNLTISGQVRQCNKDDTCHNLSPKDMEYLALNSYAQSPGSYNALPKLELTEFDTATEIVHEIQRLNDAVENSKSSSGRGFAYTSVLGYNPDESQNTLYLDALRVMIRSLKSSNADFVVLMMYRNKEAEALLKAEGTIIRHIDPMKHSLDISYFEPWFVDIAFAKLRAFELTQYKRVQILDIDALIASSDGMDKMFTLYQNAKLVAEGLGADSPLRAGWLMIEPSTDDFDQMEQLLERGTFSIEQGWDNLNLPMEYPGWTSEKPTSNWEFYGSVLEQGEGCLCQLVLLSLSIHISFVSYYLIQDYSSTNSMHCRRALIHPQKIASF